MSIVKNHVHSGPRDVGARRVSFDIRWSLWFLIACALLGPSCARRPSLPKGASWNPKSATFEWWGDK